MLCFFSQKTTNHWLTHPVAKSRAYHSPNSITCVVLKLFRSRTRGTVCVMHIHQLCLCFWSLIFSFFFSVERCRELFRHVAFCQCRVSYSVIPSLQIFAVPNDLPRHCSIYIFSLFFTPSLLAHELPPFLTWVTMVTIV